MFSLKIFELKEQGLEVRQQVPVPFVYKEIKQEVGYRLDILVENKVIIEVKSVESLASVHYAQTLTYLKLYLNRCPNYPIRNFIFSHHLGLKSSCKEGSRKGRKELLIHYKPI